MPDVALSWPEQVEAPGSVDADAVAVKAMIRVFRAWALGGESSSKLAGVSQRT